ncbi:rCG63569 [Rattus norvegicus]|uniref:RCG63569 n=1 Tax=Rattus norvegicus TaxID=10116 RepID=A6IVV6_RAT|nr:rCG63569 [Rattus norvegicus]
MSSTPIGADNCLLCLAGSAQIQN